MTTRPAVKLSLLPPSSPILRQRVTDDVPLDLGLTLDEVIGQRALWPVPIRAAYGDEVVTLSDVISDLRATFDRYDPFGLAAPQVGLPLRIVLVRANAKDKPIVMINPRIVGGRGTRKGTERCLSVPGVKREVRRYSSVEVEWVGMDGEKNKTTMHGFLAAVVQHEIDHLDGILMTSR